MEKYPNRKNYDQGFVEAKHYHFRHLKSALRPLPLDMPCEVHLTPQKRIRVTLFDVRVVSW
jgi:DNA cross-link repair 1C protein